MVWANILYFCSNAGLGKKVPGEKEIIPKTRSMCSSCRKKAAQAASQSVASVEAKINSLPKVSSIATVKAVATRPIGRPRVTHSGISGRRK